MARSTDDVIIWEVVRHQIKNFASTRTVFNKGFKLVILDEADAMTNDAQVRVKPPRHLALGRAFRAWCSKSVRQLAVLFRRL